MKGWRRNSAGANVESLASLVALLLPSLLVAPSSSGSTTAGSAVSAQPPCQGGCLLSALQNALNRGGSMPLCPAPHQATTAATDSGSGRGSSSTQTLPLSTVWNAQLMQPRTPDASVYVPDPQRPNAHPTTGVTTQPTPCAPTVPPRPLSTAHGVLQLHGQVVHVNYSQGSRSAVGGLASMAGGSQDPALVPVPPVEPSLGPRHIRFH